MTNAHLPMLTTSEVARLARVSVQSIQSETARTGAWRDITPTRQANGHYLWPTEDVDSALGLVPDWNVMTPSERAWGQFLDLEAVPRTSENFRLGQLLLNGEPDFGRDPSYYADEATLLAETFRAGCERVEKAMPAMDERDRARVRNAKRLIANCAGSFDDLQEEGAGDE